MRLQTTTMLYTIIPNENVRYIKPLPLEAVWKKRTLKKIFTLLKSFESSPAPYYHEILADIIFDQWGTNNKLVYPPPTFKPSLNEMILSIFIKWMYYTLSFILIGHFFVGCFAEKNHEK